MHRDAPLSGDRLTHLLQDNYETPVYQHITKGQDHELQLSMLESRLSLSVSDFLKHAQAVDSADELSIFIARQLMQRHAPSLMMLTLHDMDIAHSGAFSLYVDAYAEPIVLPRTVADDSRPRS